MADPKTPLQRAANMAAQQLIKTAGTPEIATLGPEDLLALQALYAELVARSHGGDEDAPAIDFHYDNTTDTLKLEGIAYAYDVFRNLRALPEGAVIQIVRRQDDVLTLRRLDVSVKSAPQVLADRGTTLADEVQKLREWMTEPRAYQDEDQFINDIQTRLDAMLATFDKGGR